MLKRRNDNAAPTATSLPATTTQIYAGFYINLDRSPQRKAEIEEQLAQYQLGFYGRFPAADGNILNFTNPYLTDAEIGCFTSHYLCLKDNLDCPHHLHIMEDDVLLSKYTAKAIDTAFSQGFMENFDVLFTDIWIPPNQQDYKAYIDLFYKNVLRDSSGYITKVKFIALDLKSRVFAGTASFLVNNRSISKLHDLFAKELESQPRANVDLFLRRKAREGVLKLGCLFPFVTSIRLEHVIATTAIGRHDTLSDLACNIARYSFFVDHDLGKCQAYVTKFLHTAGNEHVRVLGSILGFALSDEFRPF